MGYLTLSREEKQTYKICFIVPYIRSSDIMSAYVEPYGLDTEDILVISPHYSQEKKKTPMKEMREYIENELAGILEDCQVKYLFVADGEYFKALTKASKVEANIGYALDSEFGSFKVIYVPQFRQIFHNPEKVTAQISAGIKAMQLHETGMYLPPGNHLIKQFIQPKTLAEIKNALDDLIKLDVNLTCDIEAFSLKHHTCGIGSIAFAWNQNEGVAFLVDYEPIVGATQAPFGRNVFNKEVRALLLDFFLRFKRKMIYHNIAFDVYALIYQLFMKDILDTEGTLKGMEVMLRDWDCTKLISYLATNSCAGNKLSLKDLAQEYAGNYGLGGEIKDITRIPSTVLLEYNLLDCLSTWFVRNKYHPKMVADNQEEIYEGVFKDATLDIIQMQLTGMPLNMRKVKAIKYLLGRKERVAVQNIRTSYVVQEYTYLLKEEWVAKKNAGYKKKRITIDDADEVEFNPRSGPQVQALLYEHLALPILDTTDSGEPSTKADVLEKLLNHTEDEKVIDLLKRLLDYKSVAIIISTFIPAMENAALGPDGWHYLFGNFNLGGTVSGRLSSSKPNLQNLPASSIYAKWIKYCFEAPKGWVFCGLDFASLEDKISAKTTKDPNKIKVYTDGFDGHSLRAYFYFGILMPDITEDVASINSIATKYKSLRQESKAPTFALTYQGTYVTLMNNCGFDIEKAKLIETRYHEMYKVSDEWVAKKLDEACRVGYVTVAFGLRVRTPLLKQVIRGTSKTPYEAEAEGRTAGNALGQSWCLLNSRACSEFMSKVRKSKYRLDIRPCAQIHDAQYYLIRDDVEAIAYTNEHLVEAVNWQDHPDIKDDLVPLGGELSIFYPSWANEIVIPNGADAKNIIATIDAALIKGKK